LLLLLISGKSAEKGESAVIVVTTLFFLDTDHGPDNAIYHLYGFFHVIFFMLVAIGLARLSALSRLPFSLQFPATMLPWRPDRRLSHREWGHRIGRQVYLPCSSQKKRSLVAQGKQQQDAGSAMRYSQQHL